MVLSQFLKQFNFQPQLAGYFGIEREYFLVGHAHRPNPRSPEFLKLIADPSWTYELSACQVEHRTKPLTDRALIRAELATAQKRGRKIARAMGLALEANEVGPASMPLDIYPDDPRYAAIAKTIPAETLLAASRVTGVHIHYGVRDIDGALAVHNLFVEHLSCFIAAGDGSGGERIRLYKTMAKNWQPPHYRSPQHLFATALEQGFADNPRDCWHLIRITRHGTVELRMFGMTDDIDRILSWVGLIEEIVRNK